MAEVILDIPEVDLGVKISKVKLKQVRLANDNSGTWYIDVEYIIDIGARKNQEQQKELKMNSRELHTMASSITISREDIATKAGISSDFVRTSLTVDQLNSYVFAIVIDRILALFS